MAQSIVSIRRKRGGFSDGDFAQKVLALTNYDGSVLSKLYVSRANKQKIERGAAHVVTRYFDAYIDAKARENPKSLHHVYEFDMAGSIDGRLFKKQINSTPNGAVISYRFVNAKNPNRQGYPFKKKASVMESGETVVIKPKNVNYLQYVLKDGRMIRSKMSIVDRPGGDVAGNFGKEFDQFTRTSAKRVLKEVRYFEKIRDMYKAKRKIVVPRINSSALKDASFQGSKDALEIATQAERMYSA